MNETTTQENLLQTLFELESENERLHDAFDGIIAEIQDNINYNKKMDYQGIALGLLIARGIVDKYRKDQE